MNNETDKLDWESQDILINNEPHRKFLSKTENWCYTVEPLVKAKRPEPLGYYFAGWAKKGNSSNRMRTEGNARTIGECTAICQAHMEYVRDN